LCSKNGENLDDEIWNKITNKKTKKRTIKFQDYNSMTIFLPPCELVICEVVGMVVPKDDMNKEIQKCNKKPSK
jgi:hypothetical protein